MGAGRLWLRALGKGNSRFPSGMTTRKARTLPRGLKPVPYGFGIAWHGMQRRPIAWSRRAFARWPLPVVAGGRWLRTLANSRFPSGMTTKKALHAADARFARHAAGVAAPGGRGVGVG